jgi:hypothetical protein
MIRRMARENPRTSSTASHETNRAGTLGEKTLDMQFPETGGFPYLLTDICHRTRFRFSDLRSTIDATLKCFATPDSPAHRICTLGGVITGTNDSCPIMRLYSTCKFAWQF